MNAVELRSLTRILGNRPVLDALDLAVETHARVALLGPSGSGKTTLLRLVAGLDAPDAGAVFLDGVEMNTARRLVPPHERNLGFVFQSTALWPHMTVAQNVVYGARGLDKLARQQRLDSLLSLFEIEGTASRYPDQISGGEARRVAFARALATDPRLLLLDEPFTNLDEALKGRLMTLVDAATRDRTVLFVTHDEAEAAQLGDRVVRMAEGRVVEYPGREAI